jgi:hypothetical protein
MAKEYWSRLWIYQEIVLGQQRKLQIGTNSLSWDEFSSFVRGYQAAGLGDFAPRALYFRRVQSILEYSEVLRAREMDWADALLLTETSQFSVPLDRIYALNGLVSIFLKMKVDYTITTLNLFSQVAEKQAIHLLRVSRSGGAKEEDQKERFRVFLEILRAELGLYSQINAIYLLRLEHDIWMEAMESVKNIQGRDMSDGFYVRPLFRQLMRSFGDI